MNADPVPHPDNLIPALREATLEEAGAILARLDLETIKPVAREICGLRKIGSTATAESLGQLVHRQLEAERQLAPAAVKIGDRILDEDSGEEVEVTTELQAQVHDLNHRLQQAEYSVGRGLVEICRIVKEFRDSRAYLFFGYSSFRKFCDAGRLQVLGQTRTRRWALQQIQIIETLGEEVVNRNSPLGRNKLLRLSQVLSEDGMEATLEELREQGVLRYTDERGQEVTLPLPKTAEEAARWQEGLGVVLRRADAARREALEAEDALVSEREGHARERQEYDQRIAELEEQLRDAEGRGEDVIAELAKAEKLTPEQVVKLQKTAGEIREEIRRAKADLRDAHRLAEQQGEQLAERRKLAEDIGSLKRTREICETAQRIADQAIDAMSDLRALGPDIPPASRELAHDMAVLLESQFRQLADEFTALRDEG